MPVGTDPAYRKTLYCWIVSSAESTVIETEHTDVFLNMKFTF